MKRLTIKKILPCIAFVIVVLCSCSDNKYKREGVYFSKDVSQKDILQKLVFSIKTKNGRSGCSIDIKNHQLYGAGQVTNNGFFRADYHRLVLVSPEGFEVYFVFEEKKPEDKKATIKTVTIFFPFDQITTKTVFDKYQITGQFIKK